jgi:hypothetical protein
MTPCEIALLVQSSALFSGLLTRFLSPSATEYGATDDPMQNLINYFLQMENGQFKF